MYRDILKKTGTYSLATFASRAASFLLLPVYTRFLSPADYGIMELLDVTMNVVGLLVGTRISQALFYFYFAATNKQEKERYVSTSFAGAALVGVLYACLTLPAAPALSGLVFGSRQYGSYLRLVFLGFAFLLPLEVGLCYMRARGCARQYVGATVGNLGVNIVLTLILIVGFGWGVKGMLTGSLVSSMLLASLVAWKSLAPIQFSFNTRILFRLLWYSAPLGLSGLAVFLIHYGDRMFLRSSVSLTDLGIYSLAYKIGMVIANVHAPFLLHWNAQVCAIMRRPEGERVYVRTCTYVTAALTLVAVGLSIFIQPVLRVMAGPAFFPAAALVPWLAAAYVIRALGAHLQGVFVASGRPGLEARVNTVGSLACLAAYAVLIPRFKLWGAVAATVIGFTVILVYGFWEAQRVRAFQFEYGRLARIASFGIATVGLFQWVRPANMWTQAALGCLFSGAFLAAVWAACLDSEERSSVARALSEVRQKMFSRKETADVVA
jgi:O-antigen/teichoic acid export membrane protein